MGRMLLIRAIHHLRKMERQPTAKLLRIHRMRMTDSLLTVMVCTTVGKKPFPIIVRMLMKTNVLTKGMQVIPTRIVSMNIMAMHIRKNQRCHKGCRQYPF